LLNKMFPEATLDDIDDGAWKDRELLSKVERSFSHFRPLTNLDDFVVRQLCSRMPFAFGEIRNIRRIVMFGKITDVIRNDSKLFGQRCLRFSALKPAKNFFSLLDAKSPRPHSSLSRSVLHIVSSRSKKKMIWPDAITDITSVENTFSLGNRSKMQLPRKSMRGDFYSPNRAMDSVASVVQFSGPEPARVGLVDVFPKRRDRINRTLMPDKKASAVISPTRRNDASAPASAQLYRGRCGSRRILSQYGEWHFAHTFGLSGRRGHQRCPQRLHRTSRISGRIDNSILLTSSLVNSQLVAG
jgi:hypothetical protein